MIFMLFDYSYNLVYKSNTNIRYIENVSTLSITRHHWVTNFWHFDTLGKSDPIWDIFEWYNLGHIWVIHFVVSLSDSLWDIFEWYNLRHLWVIQFGTSLSDIFWYIFWVKQHGTYLSDSLWDIFKWYTLEHLWLIQFGTSLSDTI